MKRKEQSNDFNWIIVDEVKCFLTRSCEWANFYEGKNLDGTNRTVRVSKFSEDTTEKFFEKYSPNDFDKNDIVSIAISFAPRNCDGLPEDWKQIMMKIQRNLY